MPKVFVHGVPESDAVWRPLLTALTERGVEDIVTLSPPGFGVPTPDGWEATPANYVDWLADELASIDGPIDLVGHDWGTGHVVGTVASRPDLVRSWAIDVAGLLHPDYEWHDTAQAWQTPEVGEQVIEMMAAPTVDERAATYREMGMPADVARDVSAAFDETMGRCILELYRAATQPALRELGDRFAATDRRPGLVLNATADAFVPTAMAVEVADRMNAQRCDLVGEGHWWMTSPGGASTAADGLAAFWTSL